MIELGPHVGHPILRKKRARFLVVIGRYGANPDDEIWTWSRNCIRDIERTLQPHDPWQDFYRDGQGLTIDKPFVTRRVAEGHIINGGKLAERIQSIHGTIIDVAHGTGAAAERVVDHLIAEGVLRHPTKRRFGSVVNVRPALSRAQTSRRPMTPADVYEVDEARRDEWVATRLLLLSENHLAFGK